LHSCLSVPVVLCSTLLYGVYLSWNITLTRLKDDTLQDTTQQS